MKPVTASPFYLKKKIMSLTFSDLVGSEIEAHIERLAQLRIAVFREWPYLYDGSLEYERKYLANLAASPHGYAVLARDGDNTIVGASTAMPLTDADAEFQKPFQEAGLDPEDYFYFGESVLLPEYRGRGAGVKFFEEREAQAHFLAFPFSCFCTVLRPQDHPERPDDHQSLERLWGRRGFKRHSELVARYSWLDLGAITETEKQLEFWIRRETVGTRSRAEI